MSSFTFRFPIKDLERNLRLINTLKNKPNKQLSNKTMNSLIYKTILATTIALANGLTMRTEAELTADQSAASIINQITPAVGVAVDKIV